MLSVEAGPGAHSLSLVAHGRHHKAAPDALLLLRCCAGNMLTAISVLQQHWQELVEDLNTGGRNTYTGVRFAASPRYTRFSHKDTSVCGAQPGTKLADSAMLACLQAKFNWLLLHRAGWLRHQTAWLCQPRLPVPAAAVDLS